MLVATLAWGLTFATAAHAGVVVTPSSLVVLEGGAPESYSIQLGSMPPEDVVVTFDVPDQLEPIAPVTFTPNSWNQPQTVGVFARHDFVAEGDMTVLIRHGAAPVGATSPGPLESPVSVSITDDDYANLMPSSGVYDAGEGDRVSWSVSLQSQPTHDVHVTFADDDPAQTTVVTSFIVFTPENWATPQLVEVDIDDDEVAEGDHFAFVDARIISDDPGYNGSVSNTRQYIPITDNDFAGIVLTPAPPTALALIEGGEARTYAVRLATPPIADVEIEAWGLSSSLSVEPGLLTFTPANWNQDQLVAVSAINDAVPEASPSADAVVHAANSADPQYASPQLPDMLVQVTDDDSPGFLVQDPYPMTLAEADATGTERVIHVRLSTAPAGTVRVNAVSDGQVVLASTSALTFDASNWSVAQQFRVRAYDDAAAEGTHPGRLSFTITAPTDPTYASLGIAARTFEIADDDLADARVECVDGPGWSRGPDGRVALAEDPAAADHAAGCYLQLGTAAQADVTVSISTSPAGQVAVDVPRVTIPTGEQGPVLVTFTAVDDARAEGGAHQVEATFAITSSDAVYGSLGLAPVTFEVADDDLPGVRVLPDGPIALTEGGTDLSLSVTLASQPTTTVSVTVVVGAQLQLVAGSSGSLVFSPSNWNVPQTVRVVAVDDQVSEGAATQSAPIAMTVASSDPDYDGIAVPSKSVDVGDDDHAGVVVTPTGDGTASREGGAGDEFSVRLATEPTAVVTVSPTPDSQVTATPATLTFTRSNWNVPQVVTVQSVQDTVYEGAHVGHVRLPLTSDDPAYAAGSPAEPQAVAVAIADDDPGGAVVAESDGSTTITEAGGTDTYTLVLNAQPTGVVVIRTEAGVQATAQPAAVTFTTENWSTPQTVTLTAVQDDVDEVDPHTAEVGHVVDSAAAGWAGTAVAAVSATVVDDDAAAVVVTQTDGSTKVAEGAKTGDSITIALTSRPASDVTITPTADPQLVVDTKPIVLTPTAWKEPRTLNVAANDDKEHEGEHVGSITFAVASSDPGYAKSTAAAITVAIVDNDSDVTLTPGDDGGGTEEDEEATRGPRGTGGGDDERASRPRGGGGSGARDRRTEDGKARTEEGRERTGDGLGLGTTNVGGDGGGDDADDETPELDGEVVSASERPKPKKRSKPSAIRRAMTATSDWVKDNRETAATIGGLGLMAISAGTFLLRGDPIKTAQRGLSSTLPKPVGEGPDRRNGRRVSRLKKKQDRKERKLRRRQQDGEPAESPPDGDALGDAEDTGA